MLLLFPWNKLVEWVTGTIWRTILLLLSILPLDDGLETLSDQEVLLDNVPNSEILISNQAGNYDIFITVGAVALTLGINYLVWWGSWWFFRQACSFTITTFSASCERGWKLFWAVLLNRNVPAAKKDIWAINHNFQFPFVFLFIWVYFLTLCNLFISNIFIIHARDLIIFRFRKAELRLF